MSPYKLLMWVIIVVWLPFSIPLMIAGAVARFVSSSVIWGWEIMDSLLEDILKRAMRARRTWSDQETLRKD